MNKIWIEHIFEKPAGPFCISHGDVTVAVVHEAVAAVCVCCVARGVPHVTVCGALACQCQSLAQAASLCSARPPGVRVWHCVSVHLSLPLSV